MRLGPRPRRTDSQRRLEDVVESAGAAYSERDDHRREVVRRFADSVEKRLQQVPAVKVGLMEAARSHNGLINLRFIIATWQRGHAHAHAHAAAAAAAANPPVQLDAQAATLFAEVTQALRTLNNWRNQVSHLRGVVGTRMCGDVHSLETDAVSALFKTITQGLDALGVDQVPGPGPVASLPPLDTDHGRRRQPWPATRPGRPDDVTAEAEEPPTQGAPAPTPDPAPRAPSRLAADTARRAADEATAKAEEPSTQCAPAPPRVPSGPRPGVDAARSAADGATGQVVTVVNSDDSDDDDGYSNATMSACYDEAARTNPELAAKEKARPTPSQVTPRQRKRAPLDAGAPGTPAHHAAFEGRPPQLARLE